MKNLHNIKRLFKPLDFVIIAIALGLIVLSLFFTFSTREDGESLIVTTPDGDWVYALSDDVTIDSKGTLGNSVIVIDEGKAFFVSSPCDNQLCVHSNPIHSSSQFIACLPNQIFIRVESTEVDVSQALDDELDVIGF